MPDGASVSQGRHFLKNLSLAELIPSLGFQVHFKTNRSLKVHMM